MASAQAAAGIYTHAGTEPAFAPFLLQAKPHRHPALQRPPHKKTIGDHGGWCSYDMGKSSLDTAVSRLVAGIGHHENSDVATIYYRKPGASEAFKA